MNLLVNVDVADLARAIAFYTDGLGLRLKRRLFNGMVAEMYGASSTIYLLTHPAGSRPVPGAASVRAYERHWTPVHLDFETEDIEAAVARAINVGAKLEVQVVQFEPNEKVAFVWLATGLRTKVTLTLVPEGDGTKLVATEAPFPLTEDAVARAMQQAQGWTHFCCCLKAYLQHGIDLRRGRSADHVA